MLGDNPEKSRNPLKIAMRRRNAKTVQFAAPTYCDPPPMDYSTDEGEDEEEDGEREYTTQEEENSDHQGGDRQEDQNEKPSVEPAVAKGDVAETNEIAESKTSLDSRDSDDHKKAAGTERTSEEAVERSGDLSKIF